MSQHVDGEEALYEPLLTQAKVHLSKLTRLPVPDTTRRLLEWLARESFRAGFQHAHSRTTVKDELRPQEEVEK